MRLGIQAKLLGLIAVACVLPLMAAVVALQAMGYRERVRERRLVLQNEAVHVTMNLRASLEKEVVGLTDRLAGADVLALLTASGLTRRTEPAARFLQRMRDLDQQWAQAGPDSPLVSGVVTNAIAARLSAFTLAHPLFAEILVTDPSGELVAATSKTSDYFQADEEWWMRAAQLPRGRVWVEGPHWDDSAKVFSVDICMSLWVTDPGGNHLVGVLKGVLNTSPMFASVPFVLSSEGIVREIVDPEGRVLLRLADEEVLRRGEHLSSNVVLRLSTANPGAFLERDEAGELQMVGYAPLALVGVFPRLADEPLRSTLFVVVHQPASATLTALRLQALWMTAAGLGLGLVFAGIGLYRGHRDFIVPLQKLRSAAHAVASTTRVAHPATAPEPTDAALTAVAGIRTGDEIESLAGDFGAMAKRVLNYHQEMAAEIGRQTAEIARKTEALEGDLATAREFQRAFLPQAYPCVPDAGVPDPIRLRFHHVYQPASTLGGDFFDLIKLSEHQAGILIADVMGHGTRSALVTAMLRTLVQDVAGEGVDPGLFLARLNRRFSGVLNAAGESMFATAFYLVADTKAGEIQFATAGHPSPLLGHRQSRVVAPLLPKVTGNPALGLFPEARYVVHRRPILAGDVCVLFTDGAVEAVNPNDEEYGRGRLMEAIRSHLDADAATLSQALVSDLVRFGAGQPLADDVCLVVVEVAKSVVG